MWQLFDFLRIIEKSLVLCFAGKSGRGGSEACKLLTEEEQQDWEIKDLSLGDPLRWSPLVNSLWFDFTLKTQDEL